jgi:hypothetical protein
MRKTVGPVNGPSARYDEDSGFDMYNKNKRTDTPEFRPGDTIRIHVKIRRPQTSAGI